MRATHTVFFVLAICGVCAAQESGTLPPHVRLVKPLMPGMQTSPTAPKRLAAPPTSVTVTTPGQSTQRPARCGHIIVHRPPANLDSKAVIPAPKDWKGSMPVFKALPPCPEDIR